MRAGQLSVGPSKACGLVTCMQSAQQEVHVSLAVQAGLPEQARSV